MDEQKYKNALRRNLIDLTRASWEWHIITSIEKSQLFDDMTFDSFPEIVHTGLLSDYLTRLIRTFEEGKHRASFWYIYDIHKNKVEEYLNGSENEIENIKKISSYKKKKTKLKLLRNMLHFHRSKDYIDNYSGLYKEADINRKHLKKAVDDAKAILAHLYYLHYKEDFFLSDYDGKDVQRIMKLLRRSRILSDIEGPLSDIRILDIRRDNIWLMTNHGELFIHFQEFPQFRDATIKQIYNYMYGDEENNDYEILFWPDLDIRIDFSQLAISSACCLISSQ